MRVIATAAAVVALLGLAACKIASMHVAAMADDPGRIETLLADGYDVNAKDAFVGQTGLMVAAFKGSLEAAKLLVDRGADLNARDNSGATALMYAAFSDSPQPGKLLNVAALLIDRGADVNAQDERGTTALMYAAAEIKPDMARLLIDRGAKVEAANADGIAAPIFRAFTYYDPARPAVDGAVADPLKSSKIAGPAQGAYLLFPQDIYLLEDRAGAKFPLLEGPNKARLIYSRSLNGKRALGYVASLRSGNCRLLASLESKVQQAVITGKKIQIDFQAAEGKVYRLGYYANLSDSLPTWRAWIEELEEGDRVTIIFKDIKAP